MKNLKWTILGLLVMVLCTTQTLGQPQVACGVAAYEHGTSNLVTIAHDGEVLDYVVQVTNGPDYPIANGVVTLTLPDTSEVLLDPALSLPAGGSKQYPVTFPPVPANQQYTIASSDIGNNSAPANSVQALSRCEADATIPGGTVVVTGTGQWPTLVVTPCVNVEKSVEPEVSKIGDDVLYTIEVCNCDDEADLTLVSFEDTVLDDWYDLSSVYSSSLPAGECEIHSFPYTIQPDDPDPLENVVTVVYEDVTGFDVTDTDRALVDLVEVCIEIDKTVDPEVSKVGDEVLYTICIYNCQEWPLENVVVEDPLLGGILPFPPVLAPDELVCLDFPYVIQPGDPDPLDNCATVESDPEGPMTNPVDDRDCARLDLVEPAICITKDVDNPNPCYGDIVTYTICIDNCGDYPLENIVVTDPHLGGVLAGFPSTMNPEDAPVCVPFDYVVQVDDPCPLINTARVDADPEGPMTNPINDEDPAEICPQPCGEVCRLTGGGVDEEYSGDGATAESTGNDRIQFGGQAGANTALPPQPKGEWTHSQQKGPSGSFTFHGGTASAPAGTEVIEIRCSDPGGCKPSGDPPSPAKQVDFDGVGTFKNFGKAGTDREPTWPDASVVVNAECSSKGGKFRFDGTFHYFEVNADDNGEPGNKNLDAAANSQKCPPNGFGENGDLPDADCDCADFYRITIYNGVDAADVVWLDDDNIDLNSLNTTDVIYEFHGYLDGGNLQVHYLTGFDR